MYPLSVKNKKMLLIVLTTTIVYFSFKYLLPLVIPFVLAYLIAKAIIPVTRFLNKKLKIPKSLSGSSILIILLVSLGFGLLFVVQKLMEQILELIKNVPIYQAEILHRLDGLCKKCDEWFGLAEGIVKEFVMVTVNQTALKLKTNMTVFMTEHTFSILAYVGIIVAFIFITVISVLLIIQEEDELKSIFKKSIFYNDVHKVTVKLSGAGMAYLKTQCIIILIIACVCTGGLMLIKNEYALLIGIGIAVVDAFPVLGSGMILIPWAIVELISKDIFSAIILLVVYLISQIIRQFLEPKLLGDKIGVKPIYTFMSMYIGINLFGVFGFLLGPLGLVLIKSIVETIDLKPPKECKE